MQLELSFIKAMKDSKWSDALRFARTGGRHATHLMKILNLILFTAVELEPGCKKYVEFIPLLEEKLALAQDEDEEDDTAENGEDNDDEDEDDDDSDEEDEEDEEEDEEEDDEEGVADQNPEIESSQAPAFPDQITMENPSRITKQQRRELRASLQAGIQSLKEKEVMEKMTSLDPLLGA